MPVSMDLGGRGGEVMRSHDIQKASGTEKDRIKRRSRYTNGQQYHAIHL